MSAELRPASKLSALHAKASQVIQRWLDRSVPFAGLRWLTFSSFLVIYFIRVLVVDGYFALTYFLSLQLLHYLIQFITPLSNPVDEDEGGAVLATKSGDEFKPYVPKVQEFKLWRSTMLVVTVAFFLTFVDAVNIEVWWPLLLGYFILFATVQISQRVQHMMKFKYVPWDRNKPKFVSKN